VSTAALLQQNAAASAVKSTSVASAITGLGAGKVVGGALAVVAAGALGVSALRSTTPAAVPPQPAAPPTAQRLEPPAVAPPKVAASPVPAAAQSTEKAFEPPAPPPPARSRSQPGTSLSRELELVREAQRALDRGRPTETLSLLDRHRTEFPKGALTHEAQTLRILALCSAGQRELGHAAAERFLRAQPDSPFARRVRSSCGVGQEGARDAPVRRK
jgi:hypothetical protein